MQQHSNENLCLIAYGKFSKIVTCSTEKIVYINQGWILGEANEAVTWVPSFSEML